MLEAFVVVDEPAGNAVLEPVVVDDPAGDVVLEPVVVAEPDGSVAPVFVVNELAVEAV